MSSNPQEFASPYESFEITIDIVDMNATELSQDLYDLTLVSPEFTDDAGEQPQGESSERQRYIPVSTLGEGATGEVLLVSDLGIDRQVAMKRLKPELHHPSYVKRFINEARIVGKLEHPNIVPIHDLGVDEDGSFFFVMKRVEGETLEEIIERLREGDSATHKKFSFETRVQIIIECLRALQFAHSKGVVHRDIKPANIMLGENSEVMVMDWGLAAYRAELNLTAPQVDDPKLTQEGSLMGTPAYMAPEQAEGRNHEVDLRSDLYALGAVAYELFTLEHYLGELTTLMDTLHRVLHHQPKTPMAIHHPAQGRVPAELSHFLLRGLEKEPAKRYQRSEEMLIDLHRIVDGNFDIECPITLTKRTNNWLIRTLDRKPMVTLMAIMSFLGLFAASFGFSLYTLLA